MKCLVIIASYLVVVTVAFKSAHHGAENIPSSQGSVGLRQQFGADDITFNKGVEDITFNKGVEDMPFSTLRRSRRGIKIPGGPRGAEDITMTKTKRDISPDMTLQNESGRKTDVPFRKRRLASTNKNILA